jgi:DinB superfamily
VSAPGPRTFAEAAEEHRRAVDACAAAIRAVAEADWSTAREEKKWSPAQIAEHLAVAYDPLLSELEGRPGYRVVVPWWKRRILRWKFLPRVLAGTFPPGVPAPREVRPAATSRSPDAGARKLTERAGVFLDRLAQARTQGRARFTHPYMGRLSDVEALRLLTSHAHHHRRQLPVGGIAGD